MTGKTVGPYKIIEPSGAGGMGEVYLGEGGSQKRLSALVVFGVLVVLGTTAGMTGQGADRGNWPSYSADLASTKYSPVDQITAGNVGNLEIVWRRDAVDESILSQAPDLRYSNNLNVTPLMIDGVLYSPNAVGLAEAFDAGTGETVWVQEPVGEKPRSFRGGWTRGVAYWTDGTDRRIIVQRGRYLTALNAETGAIYPGFR